ncbi:hypothetical protein ACFE04_031960 [Oxalis oulophora]
MEDNNNNATASVSASATTSVTNVYIWDMDETLILLKSLIHGTYAKAFNGSKDPKKGEHIGKLWEDHILQLCDHFFFYEHIENCTQPFLDSLRDYDDGKDLSDYDFDQDGFTSPSDDLTKRKLAYRHRAIANKYQQGLRKLVDKDMISLFDDLYDMTDKYTDGWLSSARTFLKQCSSVDGCSDAMNNNIHHINVLVTSGSLIPSLVKCLLFRLDDLITHGNVYSSWDVGKPQCFQWIKERFSNQNVRFCVIGDGWEECEAAQIMQWPFVKIEMQPDSQYRFPGLTLKTLGYYFSAVYGSLDAENEDDES